jgi:hypothetical protein
LVWNSKRLRLRRRDHEQIKEQSIEELGSLKAKLQAKGWEVFSWHSGFLG